MDMVLETSLLGAFVLVVLALILAFARLVRGPSLPDRIAALDMMTVALVAFCGLASIQFGVSEFLDVAIVLALVGFIATVALSRYAERSAANGEKP